MINKKLGVLMIIICLLSAIVIVIFIEADKRRRKGEASYARVMVTYCITREAALILRDFYKSNGAFPSNEDEVNELLRHDQKRISCSSYYRHFEEGVAVDSFGIPLKYWFGVDEMAVFSKSPLIHHSEFVETVMVIILNEDGYIPLHVNCLNLGELSEVTADLLETVCQ